MISSRLMLRNWWRFKKVKFTLQLLLISLTTLLASAFIAFHVGLAIYLLGSVIALLNYENLEVQQDEQ